MRNYQTVISGSVALATVLQSTWRPNDLDLYLPKLYKDKMIKHLVSREGYCPFHADDPQYGPYQYPPMEKSAIWSVTKLRRTAEDGTLRFIHVIQSATPSPFSPIAAFSGTWAMNWIESDQLVVSYPRLTLQAKGFLTQPRERLRDGENRWIEKYETRGFRIFDPRDQPMEPNQPCGPTCVSLLRITADTHSLCMSTDAAPDLPEKEGCAWVLFPHFLEARSCVNPFCPLSSLHNNFEPRNGSVVDAS